MSEGRWEFDENGKVNYVSEGGQAPQGSWESDGRYHYSYRKPDTTRSGSSIRKKSDDSWHWILIVLGFIVAWPVGLILLLLQVAGKWPGNMQLQERIQKATDSFRGATSQTENKQGDEPSRQPGNYGRTTAEAQSELAREKADRQARQAEASQREKDDKRARKSRKQAKDEGAPYGLGHVKGFRTAGAIIAGIFGFAFVMELIDQLTYFISMRDLLGETLPLLALCLIGVTLLGVAASRKGKLKKFQKYLTMIGKRDVVPIAPLASAMGVSEKKAEKDLEEMLERDFWEDGYVDAARQALVLGHPVEVEPEPAPAPAAEPSPEDDAATQTLRHIRQVNDAIADQQMSDKIDRIEELTAKIFTLLEERPEKAKELRSFMNYYLPQTLKILESYSKMEAQGVEGENIAEAKAKIEGMMDKLIDGYETQLDKLFADDVLDISADLKVMERMLEKDGLTVDNELKF